MTRAAVVLLFACVFAAAAPVPKAKLTDVFGEVTDPKGECKFDMNKDGALTITVPATHPAAEAGGAGWTTPPLLSKPVEGDFVLTVRVGPHLPKSAAKREKAAAPQVMAGISLYAVTDPKMVGFNAGTLRRFDNGAWTQEQYADYRRLLKPNGVVNFGVKPADFVDAPFLRVTRAGEQVKVEMSKDGTGWSKICSERLHGLSGEVRVGPVVYGNIDQEFTATFDQYEIKPLKDEKK